MAPDLATASAPARDPGLQPERTALAWTRTAVAILANGLIAARAGYVSGSLPLLALAAALLLGAGFAFFFASLRRRVLLQDPRAPVPAVVMALTTAIVIAACFVGVVVLLGAHSLA